MFFPRFQEEWTEEEEQIVVDMHQRFGKRWVAKPRFPSGQLAARLVHSVTVGMSQDSYVQRMGLSVEVLKPLPLFGFENVDPRNN